MDQSFCTFIFYEQYLRVAHNYNNVIIEGYFKRLIQSVIRCNPSVFFFFLKQFKKFKQYKYVQISLYKMPISHLLVFLSSYLSQTSLPPPTASQLSGFSRLSPGFVLVDPRASVLLAQSSSEMNEAIRQELIKQSVFEVFRSHSSL